MIRVGRVEAERIAASFAAIPTLEAVEIDAGDDGKVYIVDVVIGEDVLAAMSAQDGHL